MRVREFADTGRWGRGRVLPAIQRFCPLCDRAFIEGEAILACQGCGVLHHPACWVKNDGCATPGDHDVSTSARAYLAGTVSPRPFDASESFRPQRSSGETVIGGTFVGVPRDGIEAVDYGKSAVPAPFQPPPRPEVGDATLPSSSAPPRLASRPLEPPGAPVRHGRYVPPDEDFTPARKPLPNIYRERGLLQYWYVPVAAVVAIVVAGGVIWAGGKLFGGGDGDSNASFEATPTMEATVFTASPTAVTQTVASGSPTTAAATVSATAAPTGGKFQINDALVVTGAGDCLNVRNGANRLEPAIVCLNDGAIVSVVGGPQNSDGFTWWKVKTALGEGWAVEDYLKKQ